MAGVVKTNPGKARKRVEAADNATAASLIRARDGSAFTRCEECKKDVPVALIGFHSCSLDAKIKMNLESHAVDRPAEVKKKPAERKKSTASEPKSKRTKTEKKEKKSKDPNTPKRPSTAFFIFLDVFRKEFKEANPDSKGVKEVAKQCGEKWKSMTDEEKKPYLEKAAGLKVEYEKKIRALNADEHAEDENEAEAEEKEKVEDEVEEKQNVEEKGEEKEKVAEEKESMEGGTDYAELEDELSDQE